MNSTAANTFMWLLGCSMAMRQLRTSWTASSFTISSISTFQKHSGMSSNRKGTIYTINDHVCPPLDEQVLQSTVEKHCRSLPLFLERKPIANHTKKAFNKVVNVVQNEVTIKDTCTIAPRVVLDSGCGTGRSSLLLGQLYPHHFVIGIDRSMARLSKNGRFVCNGNDDNLNHDDDTVQRAAPNVLLVRAELVDFWRLILLQQESKWNITHHFILYPNPYPKKSRYQHRWYAHSSFPLLLELGGTLTIRSNWKGYLQEFRKSILIADSYYKGNKSDASDGTLSNYALPYVESALQDDAIQRILAPTDPSEAWTNFEAKYHASGEPTYEIRLEYKE